MALWPHLGVETDGAHAFYLGIEAARAETAFELGKRYRQDRRLDWGIVVDKDTEDSTRHAEAGATLKAAREKARRS